MDFQPFQPPPSQHHPLNTGLSSENGTNAFEFVTGVNAYLKHIFEVLKGDTNHVVEHADDEARELLNHLADHVTALEMKVDQLLSAFKTVATPPVNPMPSPAVGGDPLQDLLNKQAAG